MERLGTGDKGQMERERFDAELNAPLPERRSNRPSIVDSGVESLAQFAGF